MKQVLRLRLRTTTVPAVALSVAKGLHYDVALSVAKGLLLLVLATACTKDAPAPAIPAGPAPDSFQVAFETSKGTITVQAYRAWAPQGVDRLYQLVSTHFFDDERIFRVVPEFVAQFGINDNKKINELWDSKQIPDDSVREHNVRGMLTYAHEGPNTRSHQLFFNLVDNTNLDTMGFAPIGKVVQGLNVMDSLYSGYGERINQHLVSTLGNSYLQRMFPKLDYIRTARIVGAAPATSQK
jgi:peptidyl-prolyl cis-trans isomerase A (cyclophilin A)